VSLTVRVLIGLAAGLVAGLLLPPASHPASAAILAVVEPVGTLFINAIRMTVIPLVVSMLIVGVASQPDAGTIGRLGARALVIFLVTLIATGVLTALVAVPLLELLPISADAAAALRESATSAAGTTTERARGLPTLAQWITDLVPVNPIRAAADGAMLPLIVFSVAFGVALTRVEALRREAVVRFFQGVADAMLTLVRWVLELAPIGVFALALPLASRVGIAAAGALASYVAIVVGLSAVAIVVLTLAAGLLGAAPPRAFVRAAAPAQAVAFSSRSSLASLPAMIEGARDVLRLPPPITSFFLPLSASVFRVGGVIVQVVGVLFVARLYGLSVEPLQVVAIVGTAVLTSFSVPGVPGGSILVMIPVLYAAGLPDYAVAGIGILLGVDTIPDMFRTTANVTGTMAAATVVARGPAARTAGPGAVVAPELPDASPRARTSSSAGSG
jgi:Na+/H+-dicarboxylate symporter